MRKIIVAILLMVCVSSVVVAEVGRYQLVSGKYYQSTTGKDVKGVEKKFNEGLFKIDTETGDVWEYRKLYVVDDKQNITVMSGWYILKSGTEKYDKDGKPIK